MYIDPNSGGILFQILAFLFMAASGLVLIFAGKIRMFWARLMRRRSEDANPEKRDDKP